MSLIVDGVWKAGVWAPTVWANGVWFEPIPIPPGGVGGFSYRPTHKRPRLGKKLPEPGKHVKTDEEVLEGMRRAISAELTAAEVPAAVVADAIVIPKSERRPAIDWNAIALDHEKAHVLAMMEQEELALKAEMEDEVEVLMLVLH